MEKKDDDYIEAKFKFPSPFRVSFFLINGVDDNEKRKIKFPSPFGVQFFLINNNEIWSIRNGKRVSVSFRSSILFYDVLFDNCELIIYCFRLLSEFNSLLSAYRSQLNSLIEKVSVSFRSSILFYQHIVVSLIPL